MSDTRLRQLVLADPDPATADALAAILGLGAPFIDPDIAGFGLTNRVYALGDQFLEVVIPVTPEAPVQRFLKRGGPDGHPGGYMVLVQTSDLAAARARADAAGIRRVWDGSFEDISASHLHPADIGAAIVSIDEARPPESWRWAGPDWRANAVPGRITGATLTSPDPGPLAARWASVLGRPAEDGHIRLDDAGLYFRDGSAERLAAFHLEIPGPAAARERARAHGVEVTEAGFRLAGVELILSAC
jgi:hypothetical protein